MFRFTATVRARAIRMEATVTYPMCRSGELLACKDGDLLVSPGTKVNGTVLFAAKAPDKYSRPRLVLDFSNILHKDSSKSPLYARVLDVDNARETVRNNEIMGIVQPHASGKLSLVMAALGAANPIAGYSIKGVQTVYGLSLRREVLFPAGTDLQVQVVRRVHAEEKRFVARMAAADGGCAASATGRVSSDADAYAEQDAFGYDQPHVYRFAERTDGGVSGSQWFEADNLTAGSAMKVVQATMRQSGYAGAPVSALLINERATGSGISEIAEHFCQTASCAHLEAGQNSTTGGKYGWVRLHTTLPPRTVEAERSGRIASIRILTANVNGWKRICYSSEPQLRTPMWIVRTRRVKASNATGDDMVTDGKMSVVELATMKAPMQETSAPVLKPRP